MRIVGLLADRDSYQGVGNCLGITVNTVRTYIRRIDEKVHVHTNPRPSARRCADG
jgi:DNA-binding CsgD family transcriptional regulator